MSNKYLLKQRDKHMTIEGQKRVEKKFCLNFELELRISFYEIKNDFQNSP